MNNNIIIVIFSLFLFFFICVTFFLFFTFINLLNEKKLKVLINDLLNYNISQKIEKIITLSDFTSTYENFISFATQFNDTFHDDLLSYRREILDIIILNKKFNVIKSYFKCKEIKRELNNLYKVINKFESTLDCIFKNDNLRSEIFIKIANYFNQLVLYYEKQILQKKYETKKINDLIFSVRKNLCEIATINGLEQDFFDIHHFINNAKLLQSEMETAVVYLEKMYINKQISLYFESNISEISKNLVSGEFNLTTSDYRMIDKKLVSLKKKHKEFNDNILFNVASTINIIRDCYSDILDIKQKMDYSLKSDDFLLKKLKPILQKIRDNEQEFFLYIKGIKDNFSNNKTIEKNIDNSFGLLKNIMIDCRKFFSNEVNSLSSDGKKKFILDCKYDLEEFTKCTNMLIKFLIGCCDKYGKIFNEISTYKKTIAKMWEKISNSSRVYPNIDDFKAKVRELSTMEKDISKDISFIDNDKFRDNLISIKAWIGEIDSYFIKNIKLKLIAEKLLVYSYRFLGCNTIFDNNVFKCEELYNNREYQKIIEILISNLKKPKIKNYKAHEEREKICQENI